MKAFHTIAIPHKDILEGRITMNVFAADLWEVSKNRGPDEYKNTDTFFRKTYFTEGLNNLLNVVEKRLKGKGGDPVIQIQTPFGGGKTHALIAMYHKAAEWGAKKVVIVGTSLSTKKTLWNMLEEQLTGKIERFQGNVAPGRESIRELLDKNQGVLILMDEVLEYITKAAGVMVGKSTLAAQTIAFIQELTETVGSLDNVCLVLTLPSSIIEHYDENAERFYQRLQKVAGRIEKIYTPVQEYEISRIIRRRLFSHLNDDETKEVVVKFAEYLEKEDIIPYGIQPSEYRDRFIDSYPFIPEVIDILYHRWGSFPTFQRTRGVLRFLSLVIQSLKEKNKPYISLADFDLANQEIRQELLKHIGTEFNSIVGADITDADSGAKKVDVSLGKAYKGLNLGSRAATTIFMYSFSGGQEHGATSSEIKRSTAIIGSPSSVVTDANEQLKNTLFYLQNIGDKYFFSNQPTLNRILLTKMENIKESQLDSLENEFLKKNITGYKFKVYIWEKNAANIADTENLKLIIMKRKSNKLMNDILKNKGLIPRVNRNTVFFLLPIESEHSSYIIKMRKKIAYEYIEQDMNLKLTNGQKKEVQNEIKKAKLDLKESIGRLYRMIAVPHKDGFQEFDIGIPTYGEKKSLDQEVYEKLRSDGKILEKIAPLFIKEKYLSKTDFVSTKQIYESSLKTPGENRVTNREVWEMGITEGVLNGLFGLGELKDDKPICRFFKEKPSIAFSDTEILIKEEVCSIQKEKEKDTNGETIYIPPVSEEPPKVEEEKKGTKPEVKFPQKNSVQLQFLVPKGKVSSIMGVMNLLQAKFETLEINLLAKNGSISEQDFEDKIKETFRQLGIDVNELS